MTIEIVDFFPAIKWWIFPVRYVFLWFSQYKTHVTSIPIGIMFGSSSGSSCGLAAWPCLAWLEMQPRIAGQQTEAVSLVALVRSRWVSWYVVHNNNNN